MRSGAFFCWFVIVLARLLVENEALAIFLRIHGHDRAQWNKNLEGRPRKAGAERYGLLAQF